jgi:peptidylprolyl isomerase
MTTARHGDTVRLHYVGRLGDGTVFDSTREREPLRVKLGEGVTLLSLEEAVVGMSPGDTRTVRIPSRRAFGAHRRNMERVLRRDQLPPDTKVRRGQRLRLTLPDGRQTIITVTRVTRSEIMYDANHPLAGQDLTFEIELVAID